MQQDDPVAERQTAQPTRALELRLLQLEQSLTAAQAGGLTRLIIPNQPAATDVVVDDVVYFDASTGLYQKALAGVTVAAGTYNVNPMALAFGICAATDNGRIDVMIGGYATWQSDLQRNNMLESTELFQAGCPYYLSDREPGKLTRYAPTMRIQILMATEQHYILMPCYANPETIENLSRVPLGMRPVGGLRRLPPDYDRAVIVGFDALECTDPNALDPIWRLTQDSDITTIKNFGYLVADATITTKVAAPFYVRLSVDTSGVITVYSAASLEFLYDGSGSTWNRMTNTAFASLNPDSAATQRTYPLFKDGQGGEPVGTLYFKFVSGDTTYPRDIVFKIPDSFQGWKMINAPLAPLAHAIVSGGHVANVVIDEPSVGYTTPPRVKFSGGGGSGALGTAVLDNVGSIKGVTLTNPGTGYTSAPDVELLTSVNSIEVANGGSGATLSAAAEDGVITEITVTRSGTNYITAPSVIITDKTGHGALAEAEVVGGKVVRVILKSGGQGYSGTPYAYIRPNVLALYRKTIQPTCTITVNGSGTIMSIALVKGGFGFTGPVEVKVMTQLGYSGPSAEADIDAVIDETTSQITGFVINNGGTGYSGTYNYLKIVTPGESDYLTPMDPAFVTVESNATTPAAASVSCPALIVQRVDVLCGGLGYASNTAISISGNTAPAPVGAPVAALTADVIASSDTTIHGSISRVRVLHPGSGFLGIPDVIVTDPGGLGHGLKLRVILGTSPEAVAVTDPGEGFSTSPKYAIGVPLERIDVEEGGDSYAAAPTVTIAPPQAGGRQATAVARLGGTLRGLKITNRGSSFNPATAYAVVSDRDADGNLVHDDSAGGVAQVALIIHNSGLAGGTIARLDILDVGWGYTGTPKIILYRDIGTLDTTATVEAFMESVGSGRIVAFELTDKGSGYTERPGVTITPAEGDSLGGGAIAQTKLMGENALLVARLYGEGGLHLSQASPPAQGNLLQIASYAEDLGGSSFKPFDATFYYNTKADTEMSERWPAVPVQKALLVVNGTELDTTTFDTVTGIQHNPRADALLDAKTIMWNTLSAVACPWDVNHAQFRPKLEADDTVIPGTGWSFFEDVDLYEVSRNIAYLHINQASRFYQSGRLQSLTVAEPLQLTDLISGVPVPTGTMGTGQVMLTLNNQVNILGGTGLQIDATTANNVVVIYQNATGRPVMVSSVILLVAYESTNSTPTAVDAAKVTIGTQAGNYRDVVGTIDPTATTQAGRSTCLYKLNQVKELFPDDRDSAPLLMPGDKLYLRVDAPVNTALIQAQMLTAKIKGHLI